MPSLIREHCVALLHVLDAPIRGLDEDLARRWGPDPRVQRLRTIPGIGPFIAMLVILEVGHIHRFPTAKHLASYAGLTPRVHASADRVRMGHISKEGNRLLRWALTAAATQTARQPGPLRAWYRSVQSRKGKKVARIALARRLTEVIYQVWKTETDFLTMLRQKTMQG